nr:hypothetical protein [Burkholderia stagnalis]
MRITALNDCAISAALAGDGADAAAAPDAAAPDAADAGASATAGVISVWKAASPGTAAADAGCAHASATPNTTMPDEIRGRSGRPVATRRNSNTRQQAIKAQPRNCKENESKLRSCLG